MGQSGAGAAPQGSGGFSAFVPLIIMFAIFYFLLIRPQQKKAKEHREMVNNIKRGDRIITSGNVTGLVKSAPEVQVSKNSKTKSD